MPIRRLNSTSGGMVASPTPTVPIASLSTSVRSIASPMVWAIGMIFLFTVGGVTGVYLANGGVDDVVHQHTGAAFHLTDDVHHLGFVGLGAALVDDRQIGVELLGDGAGTHDATNIGGNNHEIVVVLTLDVVQQDR